MCASLPPLSLNASLNVFKLRSGGLSGLQSRCLDCIPMPIAWSEFAKERANRAIAMQQPHRSTPSRKPVVAYERFHKQPLVCKANAVLASQSKRQLSQAGPSPNDVLRHPLLRTETISSLRLSASKRFAPLIPACERCRDSRLCDRCRDAPPR